jgi:hypothetical protein
LRATNRAGAIKEGLMAERRTDMDYPEHERTYSMFLTLLKWHVIVISALLVLMAIFLL